MQRQQRGEVKSLKDLDHPRTWADGSERLGWKAGQGQTEGMGNGFMEKDTPEPGLEEQPPRQVEPSRGSMRRMGLKKVQTAMRGYGSRCPDNQSVQEPRGPRRC